MPARSYLRDVWWIGGLFSSLKLPLDYAWITTLPLLHTDMLVLQHGMRKRADLLTKCKLCLAAACGEPVTPWCRAHGTTSWLFATGMICAGLRKTKRTSQTIAYQWSWSVFVRRRQWRASDDGPHGHQMNTHQTKGSGESWVRNESGLGKVWAWTW